MSFCQLKTGLIERLMQASGKFEQVLANAEKHRIQIIYTQIDRDQENNASFKTYGYRLNPGEYFYPASSIKLPAALLALEKINDLHVRDLTPFSKMEIDSAYSGQTSVRTDSTSRNGNPSIDHYIKKLFLVSDNDAFNRLYEFIGQKEVNDRLRKKGFEDIRISHRLSIPLTIAENQCTNPVRFFNDDQLIYDQPLVCNDDTIQSNSSIHLGKGYMQDGKIIQEPMEFTNKNFISLESLHDILLSVIFPENLNPQKCFHLTKTDYSFLYRYMSMYPQESDFPSYGNKYPDDYCKFLMFAGTEDHINRNIRIYNKIGQAYGFLVDMAYIVDFERKIEFVLGAVIYVNENEILNDGIYEYETIGFPFMRDLGQVFYRYELKRPRQYYPDLSKYNWNK